MKRPGTNDAAEAAAEAVDAKLRASEAVARILEDRHFRAALAWLREESVAAWRSTQPHDAAAREDAYQCLRALDRIERRLEAQAADGRVAAHNNRAALKSARA